MIQPINKDDDEALAFLPTQSGLFPQEAAGFLEQMLANYWAGNH